MDPTQFLRLLDQYGPALIKQVIKAWQEVGEPSPEQIDQMNLQVPSLPLAPPPGPGG